MKFLLTVLTELGNFLQIQSCDITELWSRITWSPELPYVVCVCTGPSIYITSAKTSLHPYFNICILHLYACFLWSLIHDIGSILNTQFHNVHGRRMTIKWGIVFFKDVTWKLITLPLHWFYWTPSQTISIKQLGVSYFPSVRRNPFHIKRHPTKMKGNNFCSACFFFLSTV